MVKGLLRFALVTGLTMLLTPYVHRFLNQLATRAPNNSFLEDMLQELSSQYSSSFVRSLGEGLGEILLGSKK
jgi:hypothetical protein